MHGVGWVIKSWRVQVGIGCKGWGMHVYGRGLHGDGYALKIMRTYYGVRVYAILLGHTPGQALTRSSCCKHIMLSHPAYFHTLCITCTSFAHHMYFVHPRYDIKEAAPKEEQGQNFQVVVDSSHQSEASQIYKLFLVQEQCMMCLQTALDSGVLQRHKGGRCHRLILALMIDVATGLAALRERNIVHGDLKPANILLKVRAVMLTQTHTWISQHDSHHHIHTVLPS